MWCESHSSRGNRCSWLKEVNLADTYMCAQSFGHWLAEGNFINIYLESFYCECVCWPSHFQFWISRRYLNQSRSVGNKTYKIALFIGSREKVNCYYSNSFFLCCRSSYLIIKWDWTELSEQLASSRKTPLYAASVEYIYNKRRDRGVGGQIFVGSLRGAILDPILPLS